MQSARTRYETDNSEADYYVRATSSPTPISDGICAVVREADPTLAVTNRRPAADSR